MARTDIGMSPWPVMKTIGIWALACAELVLEVEPAHARQPDVEHQAARRIAEARVLQELRRRAEQLHLVADRAEEVAQARCACPRHRRSRRRWAAAPARPVSWLRLMRALLCDRQADMEARAGPPAGWSAQMRPPWASTIERLIDRPMPMPSRRVVKKASNRRSRSGGIDAGAGVAHRQDDGPRLLRRPADLDGEATRPVADAVHRLDAVHQQVHDDLLELHAIAVHQRQVGRSRSR